MNERNPAASARSLIAAAVFSIVSVLLLPVRVIGYVLLTASYSLSGRASGVSGMAQAPLMARWYQHHLGTRRDEPANQLFRAVTRVPLAIPLGMGPVIVASKMSGYVPKSFRYPFEGDVTLGTEARARQPFFDGVVERYLEDVAQFVVLGAGFDTRALNLPVKTRVRSFEVDTPATQAAKRRILRDAEIDSAGIVFVAADFETEDWLAKLISAGFDPSQPALFIWEGVTMYLDKAAVEDTLRKIAGMAEGTVVAFDYFTSDVLESRTMFMRTVRAFLNASGEPLKFGIDGTPPSREGVAQLLQSCGLSLAEQRTLGEEAPGKLAWGGFAVAGVT